jgi:hypothetical protein
LESYCKLPDIKNFIASANIHHDDKIYADKKKQFHEAFFTFFGCRWGSKFDDDYQGKGLLTLRASAMSIYAVHQ